MEAREFFGYQQRPYSGLSLNALDQAIQQVEQQQKKKGQTQQGMDQGERYLSADGLVYDQSYTPLGQAVQHFASLAQLTFPSPQDFVQYWDFEDAVFEWKAKLHSIYIKHRLVPPITMGRHYLRPTLRIDSDSDPPTATSGALKRKEEEDLSGSFDHSSESPGPSPHSSTLSLLLAHRSDSNPPPLAPPPPALLSLLKASLNFHELPLPFPPWELRHLPAIPQPSNFTKYEQYEMALLRWARLVAGQSWPGPPHAVDLERLLVGVRRRDLGVNFRSVGKLSLKKGKKKGESEKEVEKAGRVELHRSGIVFAHTIEDPLLQTILSEDGRLMSVRGSTSFEQLEGVFSNFSSQTIEKVLYRLSNILNQRSKNFQKTGAFNEANRPRSSSRSSQPRPHSFNKLTSRTARQRSSSLTFETFSLPNPPPIPESLKHERKRKNTIDNHHIPSSFNFTNKNNNTNHQNSNKLYNNNNNNNNNNHMNNDNNNRMNNDNNNRMNNDNNKNNKAQSNNNITTNYLNNKESEKNNNKITNKDKNANKNNNTDNDDIAHNSNNIFSTSRHQSLNKSANNSAISILAIDPVDHGSISLTKLYRGDLGYEYELKSKFEHMSFELDIDNLFAHDDEAKGHIQLDFVKHLERNIATFSFEDLKAAFLWPLYLDQFEDVLDMPTPPGELAQSNQKQKKPNNQKKHKKTPVVAKTFFKLLTPQNFASLLALYTESSSRLVHAKISLFIEKLMSSSTGRRLLKKQDKLDLTVMYHWAVAANYLRTDIYPYVTTTVAQCQALLESVNARRALSLILAWYYLMRVAGQMKANPLEFKETLIVWTKDISSIESQFLEIVAPVKTEFINSVVAGIGHRSSTVSSFFFFILIQLLSWSEKIQELLISARLLPKIQELASSRFKHTQFAFQTIFRAFWDSSHFLRLLYFHYLDQGQSLMHDLTQTTRSGGLSLLSVSVTEFLTSTLKWIQHNPIPFPTAYIFSDMCFRDCFSRISGDQSGEVLIEPKLNLSKCLVELTKTWVRLEKVCLPIQRTEKERTRDREAKHSISSKEYPQISVKDIFDILEGAAALTKQNANISCLEISANLIQVVDILLRDKVIFGISSFCKDPHAPVAKSGWKMFYNMIKNHAGIVAELRGKYFGLVIDSIIIGHTAPFGAALKYLGKVFRLCTTVSLQQSEGYGRAVPEKRDLRLPLRSSSMERLPSSHGSMQSSQSLRNQNQFWVQEKELKEKQALQKRSVKLLAKDIRELTALFSSKNAFLKIHTALRRANFSGNIYSEMAKFCYILETEPYCQRLFKDICKNSEHKEDLLKLSAAHRSL